MDAFWVARLTPSTLELLEPAGATIAEAGSARAVFGGDLYEERELAAAVGLPPKDDRSPAELVLQAYLRSGESILPALRGVFGLVLLAPDQGASLCVRDPLGVYPLFTVDMGDELLISPSIEALLAQPGVPTAVNVPALADHLLHRWPDPAETFFDAVRRIPPGHALRLSPSPRRLYRYWEPIPPDGPVDWATEEELESFDHVLEQAVLRCAGGDQAGIFLSGGIDSVSVAATATAAARERGAPEPYALSLVFPDPDVNEEDVQTRVAKGLGLRQELLRWHDAVGPRGLLQETLDLTTGSTAPLVNLWAPAYDRLGRLGTSHGCRVILTGSGGDEWLGVTPLYAADLIRAGDVGGLYRLIAAQRRSYDLSTPRFLTNAFWRFGARPLVVEAVGRVAPGVVKANRRRNARRSIPRWLAPDPALRATLAERAAASAHRAPRGRSVYFEELRRSLDHPLVAMEMEETFDQSRRIGAPIRAAYWDADLVQLLYRVPVETLNRAGRAKGLVREALAQRFPELGFERQRKVLSIRFATSLLAAEAATAWRSLDGAHALGETGIAEPKSAEPEIGRLLTDGSNPRTMQRVWEILNLESWLRARI
jgi:asparagine synthetase B (glutamine-hydrolysing)